VFFESDITQQCLRTHPKSRQSPIMVAVPRRRGLQLAPNVGFEPTTPRLRVSWFSIFFSFLVIFYFCSWLQMLTFFVLTNFRYILLPKTTPRCWNENKKIPLKIKLAHYFADFILILFYDSFGLSRTWRQLIYVFFSL
jgi:hypothetical protein